MVFERAYVNCKRCYNLGRQYRLGILQASKDDQLYSARNDALKALEDVEKNFIYCSLKFNASNPHEIKRLDKALTVCRECDLKSPGIANIVFPGKE